MKRVLVFQHMDHDTIGRFADFFAEDSYIPHAVRLWEGQRIPSLGDFDFLFVLGGAQDVWETEKHPWLAEEKEAIREWVADRAKPYIGVCLGHQLLADALGGRVGKARSSEVGVHSIAISETTSGDPLFGGLAGEHQVMQWHHAEVQEVPAEARVLASSSTTEVQALAIDEHAVGLQFHAEFTPQTVASWQSMPSYIAALEAALGTGAYERVVRDAYPMLPQMGMLARRIYDNLMGRRKLPG
jgi:GMP synthase-like glutamine amidotransferase